MSAQEQLADSPTGVMTQNILLSIAQMERDRARATFALAMASAVERGIHVAGTIPLGYRRNVDRRLEPDPDTAPVVRGLFERGAKGWSWARLAKWAAEHGHELSEQGVSGMIRNRVYLGEARYGANVKPDAHEAIVPSGLWRRCQSKRLPSTRTGVLTERFLLQGLCACAACGATLYLSGGGRRNPYYFCRSLRCDAHAYAQARALDNFVLNSIEEALTGVSVDTHERIGPGASAEAYRAAFWIPRPEASLTPRGR